MNSAYNKMTEILLELKLSVEDVVKLKQEILKTKGGKDSSRYKRLSRIQMNLAKRTEPARSHASYLPKVSERWHKLGGVWFDDAYDDQDKAREAAKRRRFLGPDDPQPHHILSGDSLKQYHKDTAAHYARRTKRRKAVAKGKEHKSFKDHLEAIAAGGKGTPETEYEKKHVGRDPEAANRRRS